MPSDCGMWFSLTSGEKRGKVYIFARRALRTTPKEWKNERIYFFICFLLEQYLSSMEKFDLVMNQNKLHKLFLFLWTEFNNKNKDFEDVFARCKLTKVVWCAVELDLFCSCPKCISMANPDTQNPIPGLVDFQSKLWSARDLDNLLSFHFVSFHLVSYHFLSFHSQNFHWLTFFSILNFPRALIQT